MIGFGGRIRVMRGEGPVRLEGRKQVITHLSRDGPGPVRREGGRACRQAEKPMPEACAQL